MWLNYFFLHCGRASAEPCIFCTANFYITHEYIDIFQLSTFVLAEKYPIPDISLGRYKPATFNLIGPSRFKSVECTIDLSIRS